MLKLPLRNILRHRVRTALTLAAIMFGVVGLIISGGFVEDIFIQLRESTIHSQLGHIQVYRTGYRAIGRRNPYQYLIEHSESLAQAFSSKPKVSDVMRRLNFSGLANNDQADLAILGEGVEPDKESRLGTAITLVAGRNLKNGDFYEIIVGKGVADALTLQLGDYLTLLANSWDGAMNSLDFKVVGVFQTFAKDYDNRAVRIPLASAQDLLATTGVHSLILALEETNATDAVVEDLQSSLNTEFEVFPWYELADFYKKTVALYRRQFGVLQAIILVMVLLSVSSSVNMSIFERVGEFGTLRALGDRKGNLFQLIVTENFLLGILGSGGGLIVGVGLAQALSQIGIPMPPPPNSDLGYTATIRIVPAVVSSACLVGLIATTLAAMVPAYRVLRIPLADSLRQNI